MGNWRQVFTLCLLLLNSVELSPPQSRRNTSALIRHRGSYRPHSDTIEVGSHHQRAYAALKARVDASDPWTLDAYFGGQPYGYMRTWFAREAAMVALVENDASYAEKAHNALVAAMDPEDEFATARWSAIMASHGR